MQNIFNLGSFSKLKDSIGENRHTQYDGDYFSLRQYSAEKRIREVMESVGIKDAQSAMPHWETGFLTGKKLNVSSYLAGKEKCMSRKFNSQDGQNLSGKRILVQLALLGEEDMEDVYKRAVASLAVAAKLIEEGNNVSLMFCWVSYRHDIQDGSPGFCWVEASDMSIEMMAKVMHEKFFRSWIFAFRSDHGPNGKVGYGVSGGNSSTVRNHTEFSAWASKYGILRQGDVCMNWSLPIHMQIAQGIEQAEM